MVKILVTGGAGYIGSHTVKKLLSNGYEVVVVDDLSTGNKDAVSGAELVIGDFSDKKLITRVINEHHPNAVIHFAASKDAAESVSRPDKYFENNTAKTINFLNTIMSFGIKNVIFSSTAAVYGDVQKYPITEDFPVKPTNPYGESKAMVEKVLLEYQKALGLMPIILRYFNAGGAGPELDLGNRYPNPQDVVSVLMKVATGQKESFSIFGTDYDTRDGSCVRDIVHVDDLAEAHVLALEVLLTKGKTGVYNLGSENGFTVREIVETTQKVTSKKIKTIEAPRREGDIVVSIASSAKAQKELGWCPKHSLRDIIETAYRWQNTLEGGEENL